MHNIIIRLHVYTLSPHHAIIIFFNPALNTGNILLKIQLLLLLSAISKHSSEGLAATLDALDYYKVLHITDLL